MSLVFLEKGLIMNKLRFTALSIITLSILNISNTNYSCDSFNTLNNMYDLANTFSDRLHSTMRQMNKNNRTVEEQIQELKDSKAAEIKREYERKKQKLAAELGEEGKNSSYGAWRKAYLETAYANRLVESDYQIMTQESGKVLDNALKQMELASKPLLRQMNLMQQKLSQELQTKRDIARKVQENRYQEFQKGLVEHQLELQRNEMNYNLQQLQLPRKEGIMKSKREQEAFNLEKQKLEQDRITQQNILNMQREQNINQLNLEQGRLAFQKELENLRSKQYYDNLNFSVQQKGIDNLLAKTQINNDARYRIWQTQNTYQPSAIGQRQQTLYVDLERQKKQYGKVDCSDFR